MIEKSSVSWLTPRMVTMAKGGPNQSHESGVLFKFPTWVEGSQTLGPSSTAFTSALTGSWIGNAAARTWPSINTGYWCSSKRPWDYNASSLTNVLLHEIIKYFQNQYSTPLCSAMKKWQSLDKDLKLIPCCLPVVLRHTLLGCYLVVFFLLVLIS